MLAPANDPTYYTARSLDVYPRALTALDLGMQAGAGKVRATVLIDESGTVNDVRAIEAGAVEIENAARDLLLRTRFSPASKDGRMVKAQLLLNLEYGTGTGRE
jgi:outer membrane biosynthesis protein TonB